MDKIELAQDLQISRIVHGHWRLLEWEMSDKQLVDFLEQVVELGISTFDHADIYGNYACEKRLGDALALKPALRNKIQLVSKCGIKLISEKFPARKVKHYDYSSAHIIQSVEQSLTNFRSDYLDLLLLHRPSPFFKPEEVAEAFSYLRASGKVLQFGVSNFSPEQYAMLNRYVDIPLVTNQVEISPYQLDAFKDGNIDFFLTNKIKPMAWSPLAGGKLLAPNDDKATRVHTALSQVAEELNAPIAQVIYAWLLMHPVSICPIVGSGKLERIQDAVTALNLNLSLEQWFSIYEASEGRPVR